jgi:hypothetical protein
MNRIQSVWFTGVHIIWMVSSEKRNSGGEMRIAIIGIGNVGSAVARALRRAHHTIVFGTRNPSDADQATIAEAAANAGATILAVPFRSGPGRAGGFNGKALIDAINPFGMGVREVGAGNGFSTSGAETSHGAKLFEAFTRRGSRTWPTPLPTTTVLLNH